MEYPDIYVQEQSKPLDPEKTYGAWERTVSAWGEKEASPAHKEQEEEKQESKQKSEKRETEKSPIVFHWEPDNRFGSKENQQTWQETEESEPHGLDKGTIKRLSVFVAVVLTAVLTAVFVIIWVITGADWVRSIEAAISNHSQDRVEIQDEPEIEEIEAALPVTELGEDWENCIVQINDAVIALPCKVSDFTNIGLSISTEGVNEDTPIASEEYIEIVFLDSNGNVIVGQIVNSTDRELSLSECLIGEVEVFGSNLERGGLTVQFPGGIQVGSTVEAIVGKYGEADYESLNDDGSVDSYYWDSTDHVKNLMVFFKENKVSDFFLTAASIGEYTQHE